MERALVAHRQQRPRLPEVQVPGVLDLSYVPPRYIIERGTFPCTPLHLLLFHKLKAWNDLSAPCVPVGKAPGGCTRYLRPVVARESPAVENH